jgi:N-formylglutamate amidohydrolase
MTPALIVHIPHASTVIPAEVRDQILLEDAALAEELRMVTDHLTDELFGAGDLRAEVVAAPVSRLVVDVERFEQDEQEVMAARGLGTIYERRADGQPLRRALTAEERSRLLERWYRPHHRRLAEVVGRALHSHRRCLVVDAHSFPSRPLPYEIDQRQDRPDVCLGTDAFHTPEQLALEARRLFEQEGWTVEVNRPFAGALVPMPFYRRERRVGALMIEINRAVYLDEACARPLPGFAGVRDRLGAIVRELVSVYERECPREPMDRGTPPYGR